MKIYVIIESEYPCCEPRWVYGVFSSKEIAKEVFKAHNLNSKEVNIEEYTLDEYLFNSRN